MVNIDYLYNPDAVKDSFNKNYFLDKKLGFQVIEHGTILPYQRIIDGKSTTDGWGYGGIVDNEGKFVKSSHVVYGVGSYYTPQEPIQRSPETVIYLGMFHSTWGHFITDNMSRIWFLKSELMNQFKNCPIVYLLCTKIVSSFTLESRKDVCRFLEILEVDVYKLRLVEQPTQFDKIILPDESFNCCRRYTNEYRETIDCLKNFALKNRTPISNKKFYFYHGMRQIGEERLAEYFKSNGYEIISHEQRSNFDEELNLLIQCESFASNIGSISHNSVFLRDGTEAVFIPRGVGAHLNPYQMSLNEFNSINAYYLDSTLALFGNEYTNLLYIISRQLKRFFGDKWYGYEEQDFKNFLQHVKNSISRSLVITPKSKKYYAPILEDFMSQLKQREDLIAAYNMPPRWETFQPTLSYQTHVHHKGWGDGCKCENEVSNPLDQMLDVLAIKINFPEHKVYYSVYFNEQEGWSKEVASPEMAGTVGIRKPIYGIRIRLDEAGQKEFDILYRVHKFDGEWTDWAKNGETLYSYGQKLNALQIKLEPKT